MYDERADGLAGLRATELDRIPRGRIAGDKHVVDRSEPFERIANLGGSRADPNHVGADAIKFEHEHRVFGRRKRLHRVGAAAAHDGRGRGQQPAGRVDRRLRQVDVDTLVAKRAVASLAGLGDVVGPAAVGPVDNKRLAVVRLISEPPRQVGRPRAVPVGQGEPRGVQRLGRTQLQRRLVDAGLRAGELDDERVGLGVGPGDGEHAGGQSVQRGLKLRRSRGLGDRGGRVAVVGDGVVDDAGAGEPLPLVGAGPAAAAVDDRLGVQQEQLPVLDDVLQLQLAVVEEVGDLERDRVLENVAGAGELAVLQRQDLPTDVDRLVVADLLRGHRLGERRRRVAGVGRLPVAGEDGLELADREGQVVLAVLRDHAGAVSVELGDPVVDLQDDRAGGRLQSGQDELAVVGRGRRRERAAVVGRAGRGRGAGQPVGLEDRIVGQVDGQGDVVDRLAIGDLEDRPVGADVVRPGDAAAGQVVVGLRVDQLRLDRVGAGPQPGVGAGVAENRGVGAGVVELVVAIPESASHADFERRVQVGQLVQLAGDLDIAAGLAGGERSEVQLDDDQRVAGVADDLDRIAGVVDGDRMQQRADGAGAGDRVAAGVVLGGSVVVLERQDGGLADEAVGPDELQPVEGVVQGVLRGLSGQPVGSGGGEVQLQERPVAGGAAVVADRGGEVELVADERALRRRLDDDIGRGGEDVGVGVAAGLGDRQAGLDRALGVLQLPVAAPAGGPGVVVTAGHVSPGEGGERVEQVAAVGRGGHVAAVDQQVGFGGEGGVPAGHFGGRPAQRAGSQPAIAQPDRARLAVREDVDGGQAGLAVERFGELRQPVAVGVENEHVVLHALVGQMREQSVGIFNGRVDDDQFPPRRRLGRRRGRLVVDHADLFDRRGLGLRLVGQFGPGGGVEDDAVLQLFEDEAAESRKPERHRTSLEDSASDRQRSGAASSSEPEDTMRADRRRPVVRVSTDVAVRPPRSRVARQGLPRRAGRSVAAARSATGPRRRSVRAAEQSRGPLVDRRSPPRPLVSAGSADRDRSAGRSATIVRAQPRRGLAGSRQGVSGRGPAIDRRSLGSRLDAWRSVLGWSSTRRRLTHQTPPIGASHDCLDPATGRPDADCRPARP